MDPTSAAILLVAGAAMGFINNLAGAGGLIGLAALDLVAGLGPTSMNASLRPAAVALTAAGVLGFLSKGKRIPGRAWLYGLASVPGAVAGAYLAVTLPSWVYRAALVTVVVITLVKQLRKKPAPNPDAPRPRPVQTWVGLVLFSVVGLHMGFLQVAVGLVTMLALGRALSHDLVEINAAKVALLTVASCSSVAYLSTTGAIAWGPALWLAAGAACGSFAASRWTVRKGSSAVRTVVLLVCSFVLIRVAFQVLAT